MMKQGESTENAWLVLAIPGRRLTLPAPCFMMRLSDPRMHIRDVLAELVR